MWRAIKLGKRETKRPAIIRKAAGRRQAFGGLSYVKALVAVRPAFMLALAVVVGVIAMVGMLFAVPEVAAATTVIEPQQSATANPVLLAAYLKACELRTLATENISKLEAEITRNRTAADKARKIIELAAERDDDSAKRAGQTASEALRLAEASLARNEKTLADWKDKKARAENSVNEILKMMRQGTAVGQGGEAGGPLGSVSDINGQVEILKPDGTSVRPGSDFPGFLEAGEVIKTGDGSAELQILGGRATAKIGPDSEMQIVGDKPGEQDIKFKKGKFYGAVTKVGDFVDKLKRGIEEYRADLKTVSEFFSEGGTIETNGNPLMIFLEKIVYAKKVARMNPTAIFGIRGTEFAIERHEDGSGEIWVLEGTVEVTIPGQDKIIYINGGYKSSFSDDKFFDPVPFDQVDRWWEEEDGLEENAEENR